METYGHDVVRLIESLSHILLTDCGLSGALLLVSGMLYFLCHASFCLIQQVDCWTNDFVFFMRLWPCGHWDTFVDVGGAID